MLYGALKTIDYAGRIVLPRQYRNELGLEPGSQVILSLKDGEISIRPISQKCKICEANEIVDENLPLCAECLEKAKSFNK